MDTAGVDIRPTPGIGQGAAAAVGVPLGFEPSVEYYSGNGSRNGGSGGGGGRGPRITCKLQLMNAYRGAAEPLQLLALLKNTNEQPVDGDLRLVAMLRGSGAKKQGRSKAVKLARLADFGSCEASITVAPEGLPERVQNVHMFPYIGMFCADLLEARPSPTLFVVYGPPSSGKSSFTNALASLAFPKWRQVAPVFSAALDNNGNLERCTRQFTVYNTCPAFRTQDTFSPLDPALGRHVYDGIVLGTLPPTLTQQDLEMRSLPDIMVDFFDQCDLNAAQLEQPSAVFITLPILVLHALYASKPEPEQEQTVESVKLALQRRWVENVGPKLVRSSDLHCRIFVVITQSDLLNWETASSSYKSGLVDYVVSLTRVPREDILVADLSQTKSRSFEYMLLPIVRTLL